MDNIQGSALPDFPDAIRQDKWDRRFLDLAALIASWSKDPSTKCGAVIVRPADNSIASTGFNGFPKRCNDAEELYNDRSEKYQRVIHAEQNALLFASEKLDGYTIYTYPPGRSGSCDRCAAHIIQAGISRIVHYLPPDGTEFGDGRWVEAENRALELYREAEVEVNGLYQS